MSDELSKRVSEAVAEENSSSHFASVSPPACDRKCRRCREPVGHGGRRSVRVRRHQGCGARRQAPGDGRGDRSAGAGACCAGLAVTAATYVSLGGVAPVRAGLTLVKDARKVGRLGERLTEWAGRSARQIVDAPMLQHAVASGSVLRPGQTVGAIRAAFHAEKAGALVRVAKDVGRIGEKAGIRAAQDTLRVAETPKDLARAARLAEAKAGKTRAILKCWAEVRCFLWPAPSI